MKQRMKYVFVLALAAGSMALSACSGDDTSSDDDNGGSAGASGSKTGGSSPGGTTNKAGNSSGGKASAGTGTGGAGEGGMGGASEAGAGAGGDSAGAGGNVDMGGAPGSSGAAGAAGAAGAGGAGEPALVYACGSATLIQKKCSALVAANCDIPTDCSDCVATFTADRESFQNDPPCDTCNAKYDAFDQCQVDALEGGNVFAGVECVDGYGADGNADCYTFLSEAIDCQGYVGSDVDPHACPATWPPQ